jgi:hypothetical protein
MRELKPLVQQKFKETEEALKAEVEEMSGGRDEVDLERDHEDEVYTPCERTHLSQISISLTFDPSKHPQSPKLHPKCKASIYPLTPL